MRVGVVDIGTNSTRLLVADVRDGRVDELERRTEVTRLGQGVDRAGTLDEAAIKRVLAVLDHYRAAMDSYGCEATTAVLTSAVRDAANGPGFTAEVRDRYGLDARTIGGDEEAQLTFAGATSEREADGARQLVVIDIGGGSTELVAGSPGTGVVFHTSTPVGVVRQTERHIEADPPSPEELQALATEVRSTFEAAVPGEARRAVAEGIAVAGTATSCAAIAQELDPYDPARVHGYVLELGGLELLLARMASMTVEERRSVVGLHPDRAPTIVAGVVVLIEALRLFELDQVEVSEHDILRGAALQRAVTA